MRFPALRSKNYLLYLVGSVFALHSFWISRVIVGWLGWELTESATWVGIVSFILFAPSIISSPLFGVLMDRIELLRAAAAGQVVVAVAILVLYALHETETLTVWSLCAISLVVGLCTSADRSVRMTLIPRVVDLPAVPNGIAFYSIAFNIARLIGPAIGGILIDMAGTGPTILVNFAVTLPFLFMLPFMSLRPRQGMSAQRQHFMTELWDGARFTLTHPLIREAMILTLLSSVAVRGVSEILPVIADGEFHRGAEGLGQMLAVGGAGALIASALLAVAPARELNSDIPVVGHIFGYVGLAAVAALGLVDSWLPALALVAICAFSSTLVGVNMQSTIQLNLDDTYRGRVMGMWIVVGVGGSAAGSIILGTLADIFGIQATLLGAGLVLAASTVFFKVAFPRKRTPKA